jgi:hypothetical protein
MVENLNDPDKEPGPDERPLFPHRPWMVGIILLFGVLSLIAGLSDPIWLLLGAPFILALALFLYVRIVTRNKKD